MRFIPGDKVTVKRFSRLGGKWSLEWIEATIMRKVRNEDSYLVHLGDSYVTYMADVSNIRYSDVVYHLKKIMKVIR